MDSRHAASLYRDGLTIKQVAETLDVSYETARQALKGKVSWRRRYLCDLSKEEINEILSKFDSGISMRQIGQEHGFSAPAIARLVRAHEREPIASGRKYDVLRQVPLSKVQKELIVGHLLGDGHMCREGKNSLYRMTIGHKKAHAGYFHWKLMMLDPFINTWRESPDKRGDSIMLQTATICHHEFKRFAEMFYDASRVKHVPKDISLYLTPLSLAVWVMDDGHLNERVNLRLCTMNFTFEENEILRIALKTSFNIRSKVMKFKYKGKIYPMLTLNKRNTQILSDIIREHVVPCMSYKIMPSRSSTTERQAPQGDDIV